jgi:hypothetical protein
VIDCVCAPLDHKYVEPAFAVNVTDPPAQNVVAPPAVIVAVVPAFTFTVAVTEFVHPFASVMLYVIVAVPAVTPVTTPVADTVATAVFDDVHVPPVVADANCVVKPEHTFVAPVIAATVGNGFTVTVVAVDVAEHPLAFVTVT